MTSEYQIRVMPQVAADADALRRYVAQEKGLALSALKAVRVLRRSIDARQRNIVVNLKVRVYVNEEPQDDGFLPIDYPNVEGRPQVIVVGAGPGGLFAALKLIELGLRPIVLERGKDVHERKRDLAAIARTQTVDGESNYCFGEGGAGAYSDGKLFTRSKKRGDVEKILRVFCQHGASTNILADAHPHIGTDRLPAVIEAMRNTIIRCGGEVHFQTKMTRLILSRGERWEVRGERIAPARGDKVIGVEAEVYSLTSHPSPLTSQNTPLTSHPSPLTSQNTPPTSHPSPLTSQNTPLTSHPSPLTSQKTFLGPVILATGHSARDVYRYLAAEGIEIEAKGIAVGVRLEHPSALIDQIQYHRREGRGQWLPAAEYSFVTQVEGRGVYSFCMCPGGFVIPAATGPEQIVVNGMSPASRASRWSNSGMVVEIRPEDLDDDQTPSPLTSHPSPLRVMQYQEQLEQLCWQQGNRRQTAPAQRMADFVNGRLSSDLPRSSYAPGLVASPLHFWLPKPIARRLKEGFKTFGRQAHGFLTNEAVLIGVETRTSSPIRILRRDDTLQHVGLDGLFPCGEGAGYAGGIVSAAIDGERCAQMCALYCQQ